MILGYFLLVALVIGLVVYIVYMSIWNEEERLVTGHFYILVILLAVMLAQALSL